jgi:hypothetical protein
MELSDELNVRYKEKSKKVSYVLSLNSWVARGQLDT